MFSGDCRFPPLPVFPEVAVSGGRIKQQIRQSFVVVVLLECQKVFQSKKLPGAEQTEDVELFVFAAERVEFVSLIGVVKPVPDIFFSVRRSGST